MVVAGLDSNDVRPGDPLGRSLEVAALSRVEVGEGLSTVRTGRGERAGLDGPITFTTGRFLILCRHQPKGPPVCIAASTDRDAGASRGGCQVL